MTALDNRAADQDAFLPAPPLVFANHITISLLHDVEERPLASTYRARSACLPPPGMIIWTWRTASPLRVVAARRRSAVSTLGVLASIAQDSHPGLSDKEF